MGYIMSGRLPIIKSRDIVIFNTLDINNKYQIYPLINRGEIVHQYLKNSPLPFFVNKFLLFFPPSFGQKHKFRIDRYIELT